MSRSRKQIFYCQYCKKPFEAKRLDAKYCSSTCRVKLHRDVKTGNGKTWHSVRQEYAQKAQDINSVSPQAYQTINAMLGQFGGIAAEYAIAAAWQAAQDCFNAIETKNQNQNANAAYQK